MEIASDDDEDLTYLSLCSRNRESTHLCRYGDNGSPKKVVDHWPKQ